MESFSYRIVLLKDESQAAKAEKVRPQATLTFADGCVTIEGAYLSTSFALEKTIYQTYPMTALGAVRQLQGRLFQFSHRVDGETVETFFALAKTEEEARIIVGFLTGNLPDALLEVIEKYQEKRNQSQQFMQKVVESVPIPFVTWCIFGLCTLIFLGMVILSYGESLTSPTVEILLLLGADYGPLTLYGEEWRLLTSAFVHIGTFHFLFNMLILLQSGDLIERLYGHFTFAVIYIGSAVTGSLLSLTFQPVVVSAGASGAIFGIYGALVAYYLCHCRQLPVILFEGVFKGSLAFIAYNLFFGAIVPGINNWAHLGGLLGGFLFGLVGCIPSSYDEFPCRGHAPLRGLLLVSVVALVTWGGLCFLWEWTKLVE
ncbi:MAG: rhomboid family intramembrane serine protease [Planctomycetia bacterium]|nr:rhomboid family intramembrane serine protease [Planctomycetia bacterium]